MRSKLKFGLILFVVLSCVGCDQVTKSAARKVLAASEPIGLINGLIRFEYIENPGAFLGMGAQLSDELRFLLFVALTISMMVVMILLFVKGRSGGVTMLAGLALFAGGGVGNLIDRLTNDGRVVDFVSVGLGPVRTGIFNMADVAVMAGALLLFIGTLRSGDKPSGHRHTT